MTERVDVAIVGGGIVGLATAYRLLRARPGLGVRVLERATEVGRHQSSRNSGVLHAGLYYPPGSAKARWCRAGKAEMERFCAEHGVPAERTGKVVVAVDRRELAGLAALRDRAQANGVRIEPLDRDGLKAREPHVEGVAGLWSPETAVTDFGAVCRALEVLIVALGGEVRTGVEVCGVEQGSNDVQVRTNESDLRARAVATCAGLQADRVAAWTRPVADERVLPFRGSWLELRPERSHLVRGSIYPVPGGKGLPFLGVHLTRRIDGRVWVGPNAVLAAAREGRHEWSVNGRDIASTVGFRGTWRLAIRHADVALGELWRDRILGATVRAVRRYVPEIEPGDLRRGPWGVRAQLVSARGQLVDDFRIREDDRVVHVLNAPSPAATASLAIGGSVADRVLARLGD